jgi:uncharacterized protein
VNEDWVSNLFDSHDYDELDGLLADLPTEDGLRIDGAQGLLAALAIGPEAIAPSDWLPIVLGEDPELLDYHEVDLVCGMLLRLAANVSQSLDHFIFEPVFMQSEEDGEIQIDPGGWCEGFSIGIDLQSERWEGQLRSDPALMELLSPILQLGVETGVFEDIQRDDLPALTEDERDGLIRGLPARLIDLRHYWEEHRDEPYASAASLH